MFGHLELGFVQDKEYRHYQCSLCHALGAHYGSFARFLTNYDTVLPLILSMQYPKASLPLRQKICPLLTRRSVIDPKEPAMRFIATITILLVTEKIKDDIYDEGKPLPPKIMKWIEKKSLKAIKELDVLGFPVGMIAEAFVQQRFLEKEVKTPLIHLTKPTAEVLAEIYGFTAKLTQAGEHEEVFRAIGYNLGQIIYLLDTVTDYRADMLKGIFNPLQDCRMIVQKQENQTLTPMKQKEVTGLLNSLRLDLERTMNNLPPSNYTRELLTARLAADIDAAFQTTDEKPATASPFWLTEKIGRISPISLLLSIPKSAFAANGTGVGGSCCEGLIGLIILYFIFRMFLKKFCGGSNCCGSPPETVTVDHGCGGQKTYKRDSCTGKYREDKCC